MKVINYEINGKIEKVEMSDEMYEAYMEIEKESKRNNWKFEWRERKSNVSFEKLEETGVEFADNKTNIEDELLKEEEFKTLKIAMEGLTVDQKELVKRIFFKGEKKSKIAEEMGISCAAITSRLEKISKKLKKYFS